MEALRRRVHQHYTAASISHSGQYSARQLAAYEVYEQSTSQGRAFATCVLTPLPALLFVLGVDAVPLAPLDVPVILQYCFVVRLALIAVSIGFFALRLVGEEFAPNFSIPPLAAFKASMIATSIAATMLPFFVLAWNRFPIPFFILQLTPLFWTLLVCTSWILIFRRRVQAASEVERVQWIRRIKRFGLYITLLFSLQVMYSAYAAVYTSVSGPVQMLVVLFPSFFKLLVKASVAKLCRDVEANDALPQIVNFSVELFHALFVSSCLQSASSPLHTTLIILVLDISPSLLVVYRMQQSIPIGPTLPVPRSRRLTSVAPTSTVVTPFTGPRQILASKQLRRAKKDPRIHRRKLLFQCEYHVLIEYIECVVPIVSSIFLLVQYNLPNATYYSHLQRLHTLMDTSPGTGLSPLTSVILNVFAFMGLELVSFLLFSVAVRHYVGISCLKLLAFSLETHFASIQAKLFILMLYCMLFPVTHGGVDFTLRFNWTQKHPLAS